MRHTLMKSEVGLFPHFVRVLGFRGVCSKFTTQLETSADMKQSPTALSCPVSSVKRNAFYSVKLAWRVLCIIKIPISHANAAAHAAQHTQLLCRVPAAHVDYRQA